MSKRKVRIVLESRSASDHPSMLKAIAENFPDANLDIEIKEGQSHKSRRDEILELQAHDDAKHVLNENEEKNLGKKYVPAEKELVKEDNIKWRKMLAEKGVEATIKAIFDYVVEEVPKLFL